MTQAGQRLTAAGKEDHVEVDGFRIRYWDSGPPRPVRGGRHAGGYELGLSRLRQALVHIESLLELPGFGESPANTRSQSVQELASTVAQAAAQVVPENYTLIGTSFSANVALWQTLQWPDKVEALVLIAPTALLPTAGPLAGTPEATARRLFAHPEKAGTSRPLTPPSLPRSRRWCSGSQAAGTMPRQNAGSGDSVHHPGTLWCRRYNGGARGGAPLPRADSQQQHRLCV